MRTLTKPIQAAMSHVARAQLRVPAFGRATLRREGQPDLRVRIGNLSRSGFMAEAKAPPRAGTRVTLILPFGESVTATVRWSLNGRFGCRLDDAFTGRQLLALSLLAGVRVSSLLLLALLVVGVWR